MAIYAQTFSYRSLDRYQLHVNERDDEDPKCVYRGQTTGARLHHHSRSILPDFR